MRLEILRVLFVISFSGEVSLPGGRREKGDKNDAETALREAYEEIGLDPSIVEIVTVLEPITATVLLDFFSLIQSCVFSYCFIDYLLKLRLESDG